MSERNSIAAQTHKAATEVMPVRSGSLQRQCASCGTHTGGGECESCKGQKSQLQRSPTSADAVKGVPPIVHEVLNSSGQSLDNSTRSFMESRFGQDFSGVRIHTDTSAAESAQAVNALAYTVGQNIVFGQGQYTPGTAGGQKLLAHELTHVIQQGSSPASFAAQPLAISGGRSDPAEAQAHAIADQISAGQNIAQPINHYQPAIQRQENEEASPTRLRLPVQSQYQLQLSPTIQAQLAAMRMVEMLLVPGEIRRSLLTLDLSAPLSLTPPLLSPLDGFSTRPSSLGVTTPLTLSGGTGSSTGLGTGLGGSSLFGTRPGSLLPPSLFLTPPSPFLYPLIPPPGPLVRPGAGPNPPRPASLMDLITAILAVPAVDNAVTTLRTIATSQLSRDWGQLSTGGRIAAISTVATIGIGTIGGAFATSDPTARNLLLNQLNGRILPVPGVPGLQAEFIFQDSLMLGFHLDVGQLLPASLGFGPSSPSAIGGPPRPEPFVPGGDRH